MYNHCRSKSDGAFRLLKQIEQSEFEFKEYKVKKVRNKADGSVNCLEFWERPYRSNNSKSWKRHRRTQYK